MSSMSEFLNLPLRWKKNEKWFVTLPFLFLSELTALQTFIFLQTMFCNHTWIVSYTSIYNSYFPPGNSFGKRTVDAWSDNESTVTLEGPANWACISQAVPLQAPPSLTQIRTVVIPSATQPISSPKYPLLPRMFIQSFMGLCFACFHIWHKQHPMICVWKLLLL